MDAIRRYRTQSLRVDPRHPQAPAYAVAEEQSILNYHVAGYFPIKDEVPLSYVRFVFMHDTEMIIYNSPVKWVGGLRKCLGFRGNRENQSLHELPRFPCLYCGKKLLMGMHMCMECNRGIYYPTGLSLFRSNYPMDPRGVKQPLCLVNALRQSGPDQAFGTLLLTPKLSVSEILRLPEVSLRTTARLPILAVWSLKLWTTACPPRSRRSSVQMFAGP